MPCMWSKRSCLSLARAFRPDWSISHTRVRVHRAPTAAKATMPTTNRVVRLASPVCRSDMALLRSMGWPSEHRAATTINARAMATFFL